MKKIKEIIQDKKFWLFMLVAIAFFGIFIKMDYATDTYCVFATPTNQMMHHFIQSGRFITAFAQWILTALNIGNSGAYTLSILLAISCAGVSMYKIYQIFKKDMTSGIVCAIASVLIIINCFSVELYLFLEKGILMLSVLLCVLAFEKMTHFFEGKKSAIVLAFIYMLIANFSYQGTVALFVALCCLYIVRHNKTIKTFFVNNIWTALCYGIPALVNYLTVKFVFSNARVSQGYNLIESIQKIMDSSVQMAIKTYEILPKYFFVIFFVVIACMGIVYFMKQKETGKRKGLLLLGMLYVSSAAFIVTIFPQIMQSTDSIGFAPRSTYTFASLIGILVMYIFMNIKIDKIMEKILIIALIGYLSVQYVSFQNIARDRYIMNYMDYYQFLQISDKVEKYEKETGNTISKVAFYYDEVQGSYPDIFTSGDINIKAMCPSWSRTDYLEYYFNRILEEVGSSDAIYNQYFKDKNWKYYDDEQIVLIDNTMHIYVY